MSVTDTQTRAEPAAIEQFIADVLRRAHRAVHDEPSEARAILHVAERFAVALAATDPRFDRPRFIAAATHDDQEGE